MTRLHTEQCEFTYEGAFSKPAFWLVDTPGKLCDILLDAFEMFGCSSADLVLEEGEPGEWGVACDIDELDTRVTLRGDRMEAHCEKVRLGTAARVAPVLESVWSRLGGLSAGVVAKTHSLHFEADARISGASYRELLNRLARAPESLPAGTETAIVYYLPVEPARGYGESSLVLNRSDGIECGLQINATLVYDAQRLKAAEAIPAATNRLGELLRNLGLEWIED